MEGRAFRTPSRTSTADNAHIRLDEDGNYGIRARQMASQAIGGSEGNIYALTGEFMEIIAPDELQINYGSSPGSGQTLRTRGDWLETAAKIKAMAL